MYVVWVAVFPLRFRSGVSTGVAGLVDWFGLLGMGRPSRDTVERQRRELNERQVAFAVWAAMPETARQPRTVEEFCEVIGVTRQTVWRWEKDPRVIEAIRFVVLQNAGSPDRVGRVLDMLYEDALSKRDLRKAELWLKSTGVLTQFTRPSGLLEYVESEVGSFTDFSVDELERMRAAAAAAEAEREAVVRAKSVLAETNS